MRELYNLAQLDVTTRMQAMLGRQSRPDPT